MDKTAPSNDLVHLIESAKRLGVKINEEEALQWLTAIAAAQTSNDIVIDRREGVFGYKVSMLDFSPEDLAYFRKIGQLIEFADEPGVVETALALSGSAAQSKIQTYPGDCDYFERINIKAEPKEESCRILARIMREKAMDNGEGADLPAHRSEIWLLSPGYRQRRRAEKGRFPHLLDGSRNPRRSV